MINQAEMKLLITDMFCGLLATECTVMESVFMETEKDFCTVADTVYLII